jgi:hypothetical protein
MSTGLESSQSAWNPQHNTRSSQTNDRDTIALHISPRIIDVLAAYIRQALAVDPIIHAYRHLWECAWLNHMHEVSIYLQTDEESGECYLRLIYLRPINDPSSQSLQRADLEQLCQQLQQQTGLPVVCS